MESDSKSKIYSVNEITTHIKNLIEDDKILQNILVLGEISNFRYYNEKHMYFSLKDEDSIIECTMFYNSNLNLDFKPKEGMKVIVGGYIEVYKKKGIYQIIIEKMQLAGKGELYLRFLQLKEKLEKQGLFKEEFKKPIPRFPKAIGVITSLEGAAVRDIIQTIKKRYSHVRLIIYPSFVQGDEAKYTLVKGIETLNQLYIDVIIIARGGGSFEDLWSFNEESVARAIFNSKIPIVTGIGHETDFTIADFVADKRAHTPSAAAELVVPSEQEILNLLNEKKDSLKQISYNKIEILKREIKGIKGRLTALNPSAILERGYSITMKENQIISSTKNINAKDMISTIVRDGKIESEVKNKNENKNF